MRKYVVLSMFFMCSVLHAEMIEWPRYTCDCDCETHGANTDNYNSYAGVRVYANVHADYEYHTPGNWIHKTVKTLGFGTTMGVTFMDVLRLEYEALYMGAQYTASDTDFEYDIWANMLNAYLYRDFHNAVSPYIGFGLGLTGIWGEIDNQLANAFDVSYQTLIGILFHVDPRIDLEVGFKYIDFGRVRHTHGTSHVAASQLYLGATYKFGI